MDETKKVLLIGDSIRMSYQPAAAERLAGRAEVVGPAENCQYSLYTLTRLGKWLEELGQPDVVHWNNGIHDVGHNPNRRPVQFALDDYVGNLRLILKALRATGAKLIWATTTPVHPARQWSDDGWSWRNDQIDRYNAAARELMEGEGAAINDLHAVVAADPDKLLSDDKLHLSEEGIEACAEAVVRAIEPCL